VSLPFPRPHGAAGSADLPAAQGLYDPAHEHDACGVAFVVDIAGAPATAWSSRA
jgi:glutamate synthase (NADPH/NADH) large chain